MEQEIVSYQSEDNLVVVESDVKKKCLSSAEDIESKIMIFRGQQVMVDRDLAMLYGVTTKALNQAVKRNAERFPEDFMFKLTVEEFSRSQTVTLNQKRGQNVKYPPYVFTEQGVAMLSSVLRSPLAIQVNIQIMRAFTSYKKMALIQPQYLHRFEVLEKNQLEIAIQQKEMSLRIDEVFQRMDSEMVIPRQGIFFDGQVFDAHRFVSELVRTAKQRVVLFDNYVDDTTLAVLDKRQEGVAAVIYTRKVTPALRADLRKHDEQYAPIEVREFSHAHDRFLCIDDIVYHLGASLKDLGRKWFAFSRMEVTTERLLEAVGAGERGVAGQ